MNFFEEMDIMEHIVFVEASTSGAGYQAVKYAKKIGAYVTLFTHKKKKYANDTEEGDLLSLTDNIIETETIDNDIVCQSVLELHQKFPITAITTVSDYFVPIAANAATILRLPSISYKAALQCRNKYIMRLCLDKICPELNPEYQIIYHSDQLCLEVTPTKPIVIKPTDENDSYNVYMTNCEEYAKRHVNKLKATTISREGKTLFPAILAERYISGQEYSVEIYVTDLGQPAKLIGITKKYFSGKERGVFIEIGHVFPTNENKEIIMEAIQKAVKALELEHCICHIELKVVNQKVYIIEINPRLAGVFIGSQLIRTAIGTDPVQMAVDLARGKEVNWKAKEKSFSAAYFLESKACGKLKNNICFPDSLPEGIVHTGAYMHKGDFVQPPLRGGHLLAYAISKGKTENEAFNLAKDFISSIKYDID